MNKFKVGDKVHYSRKYNDSVNGIVKEVREDIAFVVFHCNNEWDRYQDFTGCGTHIEHLRKGWK